MSSVVRPLVLAILLPLLTAPQESPKPKPESPQDSSPKPRLDLYGDPLPEGALLRIGSSRGQHTGLVLSLGFSPDGSRLVTGSLDETLRIWDVETGGVLKSIDAGYATRSVRFLPDGETLISASPTEVKLWDIASGMATREMDIPFGELLKRRAITEPIISNLAVIPQDGRIIFADTACGKVRVWDVRNKRRLHSIEWSFNPWGSTIATSPGGELIAAGGARLGVWETKTYQSVHQADSKGEIGLSLSFSPDGAHLATGMGNGKIEVWNTRTWEVETTIKAHERLVLSIAYSPDGRRLATCGRDDVLKVWDIGTNELVLRSRRPPGPRPSAAIAFSPDGKLVAAALGNLVDIWEIPGGQRKWSPEGHDGPVARVAYSPDGKSLATADWNGTIRLWNSLSGQMKWEATGPPCQVLQLSFSPDGTTVASVTVEGSYCEWDVGTGKPARAVALSEGRLLAGCAIAGDREAVLTLPDGEVLRLDLATGLRSVVHLASDYATEGPCHPALSPDGRVLVQAVGNQLRLSDLQTGSIRETVPHGNERFQFITFSTDSRRLVALTSRRTTRWWPRWPDHRIRVWEVATAREIPNHQRVQPVRGSTACTLSPDGRTLAIHGTGAVVQVIDLEALWNQRLEIPRGTVSSIAFSDDGEVLAVGSSAGLVYVWPIPSPTPLGVISEESAGTKGLELIWKALGYPERYNAVWEMSAFEDDAVDFLRPHLAATPPAQAKDVMELVSQLDDPAFEVRQEAFQRLRDMGVSAVPILRVALADQPSAQTKLRLSELLRSYDSGFRPFGGDSLRRLRAIEVLERVGSHKARNLLQEVAETSPWLREVELSQAALVRLRAWKSP